MYYYPAAVEPGDDNHAFGVVIPDLPGCSSAGSTFDEAISQAHDAVHLHLDGLAASGQLPPPPGCPSRYIGQPAFQGFIWGFVSVDETPY